MTDDELLNKIEIHTDPTTGITTITMPDPRPTPEQIEVYRQVIRTAIREALKEMGYP